MTRRRVIFYYPNDGKLYMTPEFNGDRSEFAARGKGADSCNKDWHEIERHFTGVTTMAHFVNANTVAQSAYHSPLGSEILPIEAVGNTAISCDKRVYLSQEAMERYFYLLYKLNWVKKRGYNIDDYDEENGFDGGESWVCFAEFRGAELQDREYMQGLLDDHDFALWDAGNGMKCECGNNRFYGHQLLYADVIVDGRGLFHSNAKGGLEQSVYESEKPYGPFSCAECGKEYEEIDYSK